MSLGTLSEYPAIPSNKRLLEKQSAPIPIYASAQTIKGKTIASLVRIEQTKTVMLMWHSDEFDMNAFINTHQIDGYVLQGRPQTTVEEKVAKTANLHNTTLTFLRTSDDINDFTNPKSGAVGGGSGGAVGTSETVET